MPAIFLEFCLLFAVDERLHSMVIERIRLNQVDYVELVNNVLASVACAEEKPLTQLGGRAIVKLQFQVIFKFADLGCSVQITAFKS